MLHTQHISFHIYHLRPLQRQSQLFLTHKMHLERRGIGKTIKKSVMRHIQRHMRHILVRTNVLIIIKDALRFPRQHLYPHTTIPKSHHCNNTIARTTINQPFTLTLRRTMRNRNLPTKPLINIIHQTPKKPPMRTCVTPLMNTNIIMYHLMNNRVFELTFAQIKTLTNPQFEIIMLHSPTQKPTTFKRAHTHKSPRTTKLYGQPR